MPELNNGTPNPENGTNDGNQGDDVNVLKEKNQKLEDSNKQLFTRAKKAEGFELKDGEWVKPEPKSDKKPEKKLEKSDKEFGLVEKGYLRSADIVDADEVELAEKLQKETGKELDVLIETNYFKSELKDLRDAKAVTQATSDVKGGGGSKATDSVEHWVAKGVPPTREQVPDRKTRVKIARAMMDSSKSGKKFYNE